MANIQKRYAYCMGANHPQGFLRLRTLQYAERDAEFLARALQAPPCAFTETRYVIADDPIKTVIELGDFLQQPALQEQDLVVVHFSGHGHLLNG
ncbi:MAG: caspase family protein, partial [Chloroflexota bacterium]|nr:caspase family protein [Chloroflexota bacterium]